MDEAAEIEEAFLGTILVYGDRAMPIAASYINDPAVLTRSGHQAAYRVMLELFGEGVPPDITLVHDRMERRGIKGSATLLAGLSTVGTSTEMLVHYAQRICDEHNLMRLREVGRDIVTSDEGTAELKARVQKRLDEILGSRLDESMSDAGRLVRLHDSDVVDVVRNKDQRILTGFPKLDGSLGGLRPNDLIILAARTTVGKTTFALNVLLSNARRKIPVLMYSLEQRSQEIAARLLARMSGVDYYSIYGEKFSVEGRLRYDNAKVDLAEMPMMIDDRSTIDLSSLRAEIQKMMASHKIKFVVVDYLSKIKMPAADRRDLQIGEVVRGMKMISKDLKIPIMLIVQLNREAGGMKMPSLSNLKDSGMIEEESDRVILLHDPKPEVQDVTEKTIELYLAKNKNGRKIMLTFRYDLPRYQFTEV